MRSTGHAARNISFHTGFEQVHSRSTRGNERNSLHDPLDDLPGIRRFLLLSMAVPVGTAVALTRDVNYGEDDPQNGRKIYSDENIVENHIDRLSVDIPHRGGRSGFGSGCSVNSQYHRPPPVQS